MEKKNEFLNLEKKEIEINSFAGFLLFAKGHDRIGSNIHSIVSIKTRLTIKDICCQEIYKSEKYIKEENEELHKKGYTKGVQSYIMLYKYMNYINTVYSLMENLSFFVRMIHIKQNLPHGFGDQKIRLLKNRQIDNEYSNMLDDTSWYDETRGIRDEYVHFLTGFITSDDEGKIEYFNLPKGKRKSAPKTIEIKDLINNVSELDSNLNEFLDKFGKHFINNLDKNKKVANVCGLLKSGRLGAKLISYNDIVNHRPGTCQTFNMDCPVAETCEARINTDLDTGLAKSN